MDGSYWASDVAFGQYFPPNVNTSAGLTRDTSRNLTSRSESTISPDCLMLGTQNEGLQDNTMFDVRNSHLPMEPDRSYFSTANQLSDLEFGMQQPLTGIWQPFPDLNSLPCQLPPLLGLELSSQSQYPPLDRGYEFNGSWQFDWEMVFEPVVSTAAPPSSQNNKRQKRAVGAFRCPTCDHMENRKCDMNKHQRKHRPEHARPIGCDICSERFNDKKDLNRHVSSAHKNVTVLNSNSYEGAVSKRRRLHSPQINPGTLPSPHGILLSPKAYSPVECQTLCDRMEVDWEKTTHALHIQRNAPSNQAKIAVRVQVKLNHHSGRHIASRDEILAGRRMKFIEETVSQYQSTSESNRERNCSSNLGDVVAINGLIMLVGPLELAVYLSCDFNELSELKFRSLKVPK